MRLFRVLLVIAFAALVSSQTTTTTPAPTTSTSSTTATTSVTLAATVTTGSPAAPSTGAGPKYMALINTEGCPDGRALLSKAASGAGVNPGDIVLYAYLGCLVRQSDSNGQLQFYILSDESGSKTKAAAKAVAKEPGVTKTQVVDAPDNIAPAFKPPTAPKKVNHTARNNALIIVFSIVAAVFVVFVVYKVFFSASSSSAGAGGDSPNYSKM